MGVENPADAWDLGRSLALGVFGGLGFTIAIVIMAGIREELDLCDIPAPFRGAAITLIVGGILGEWWRIEDGILRLGDVLRRTFKAGADGSDGARNFAYGFLNASLLFCVGAMAIVGSFKAGTEGDYTLIFTKSVLDGAMAIEHVTDRAHERIPSTLLVVEQCGQRRCERMRRIQLVELGPSRTMDLLKIRQIADAGPDSD